VWGRPCARRAASAGNAAPTRCPPLPPFPQVRRKAEPAKDLVRDWTARWGTGGVAVGGTASHEAVSAALRDLGAFYKSSGARARLDAATADAVLAALGAAEAGLPPKEEK